MKFRSVSFSNGFLLLFYFLSIGEILYPGTVRKKLSISRNIFIGDLTWWYGADNYPLDLQMHDIKVLKISVADPDPSDPYVLWVS